MLIKFFNFLSWLVYRSIQRAYRQGIPQLCTTTYIAAFVVRISFKTQLEHNRRSKYRTTTKLISRVRKVLCSFSTVFVFSSLSLFFSQGWCRNLDIIKIVLFVCNISKVLGSLLYVSDQNVYSHSPPLKYRFSPPTRITPPSLYILTIRISLFVSHSQKVCQ